MSKETWRKDAFSSSWPCIVCIILGKQNGAGHSEVWVAGFEIVVPIYQDVELWRHRMNNPLIKTERKGNKRDINGIMGIIICVQKTRRKMLNQTTKSLNSCCMSILRLSYLVFISAQSESNGEAKWCVKAMIFFWDPLSSFLRSTHPASVPSAAAILHPA